MEFKDKAGSVVQPGDIIVHGHALGRCAGLRYAKVLALVPHPEDKLFPGSLNKVGDRDCKIRIIAVNAEWSHRPPEIADKPVVIGFGDRVMKLHQDQVPEKILGLLNGYEG